jgi:hypothetical protein
VMIVRDGADEIATTCMLWTPSQGETE